VRTATGCTTVKPLLVTVVLCALPFPLTCQQPVSVPEQGPEKPASISLNSLGRAIDLSAHYLESACGPTGRFTYLLDPTSGRQSSSYNIIRHAGAMYGLAMLNRANPDRKAVEAMMRAAAFLRASYISTDARSGALAVWSRPRGIASQASLGAAGLGLAALAEVDQAQPNTVPVTELEGLGKFILFLQRSNGGFASRYRADAGPDEEWDSLYYPGEAALGLVKLYEIDHNREWLEASGRLLSWLARSRGRAEQVPLDHWTLIAMARLLSYCGESECSIKRVELIRYAEQVSDALLRGQAANGSFDEVGRTAPTATRMEGLLAALEFLPDDATKRRARIQAAVDRGIAFLLRAQITNGPYAGGMPQAMPEAKSVLVQRNPRASDIRIDYVQHALSAWLRYQGRS
jgi:hypothetical protein